MNYPEVPAMAPEDLRLGHRVKIRAIARISGRETTQSGRVETISRGLSKAGYVVVGQRKFWRNAAGQCLQHETGNYRSDFRLWLEPEGRNDP